MNYYISVELYNQPYTKYKALSIVHRI